MGFFVKNYKLACMNNQVTLSTLLIWFCQVLLSQRMIVFA